MSWFAGFVLLASSLAAVLHVYRSGNAWGWDVFDGAVVAGFIITGIAEHAWWFGLIVHILEYSNA